MDSIGMIQKEQEEKKKAVDSAKKQRRLAVSIPKGEKAEDTIATPNQMGFLEPRLQNGNAVGNEREGETIKKKHHIREWLYGKAAEGVKATAYGMKFGDQWEKHKLFGDSPLASGIYRTGRIAKWMHNKYKSVSPDLKDDTEFNLYRAISGPDAAAAATPIPEEGIMQKVKNVAKVPVEKLYDIANGKIASFIRKNRRAVDDLNNNWETYKQMNKRSRFLWRIKNPLAHMTAKYRKEGTNLRNKEKATIERKAMKLADVKAAQGGYDLGDAAFDPLGEMAAAGGSGATPSGMQPVDKQLPLLPSAELDSHQALSQAMHENGMTDHQEGLHGLGSGIRDVMGVSQLPIFLAGKGAGKGVEKGVNLFGGTQGEGIGGLVGNVGGGLSYGLGLAENAMNMGSQLSKGDYSGAILDHGVSALVNASKLVGAGAGVTHNIAKIADLPGVLERTEDIIPGAGVVTGGLKVLHGTQNIVRSGKTKFHMHNRKKDIDERRDSSGQLSRDDERLYRTVNQAGKMATGKIIAGSGKIAEGAIGMLGSGMSFIPPLAGTLVGPAVTGVGLGIGKVGGWIGDSKNKDARTAVVNQELDLDTKIKELMDADKSLTQRGAKHVVLKSMGFSSGKRREAFHHITMRRAVELKLRANAGDEEAKKILSGMSGVYKTPGFKNREYSLQSIGEALGMSSATSWQEQMHGTVHSRAANPFREQVNFQRVKAAKKAEKKRMKEAKKQAG